MSFQFTSGPAFLLTFLSTFGYAIFVHAPFSEVWVALGSLYGIHVGRRLWRELKLNGTTMTEKVDGTPPATP